MMPLSLVSFECPGILLPKQGDPRGFLSVGDQMPTNYSYTKTKHCTDWFSLLEEE